MAGPFFAHTGVGVFGAATYGNLYEDATGGVTTITITTEDVYVGWVSATAGPTGGGVTTDVVDATADNLVIPAGGAGDYVVAWTACYKVLSNTQRGQGAVHVSGSEAAETISTELTQDVDFNTLGTTTILTLADADTIDLRFMNTGDTGNLELVVVQLSIIRIG